MDSWDISPIQAALDDALVTVAHECWFQLSGEQVSTDSQLFAARNVESSLESLTDLQRGGIPTYNDWDALFYLTWYQPKQINVFYSLLQWLEKDWFLEGERWWDGNIFNFHNGNTHVIDFGCGSLATLFAIAIAAARSYSTGIPVSNILIDNIDNSRSMIKLGERTWDEFVSIMTLRHPNHPICKIFDKIDYKTHLQSYRIRKKQENSQCFIVAMHCAYEETINTMRTKLSKLCNHFEPKGVFITSHDSKLKLLEQISSQPLITSYVEITNDSPIRSQFGFGKLVRTTEWRKILAYKLHRNRNRMIESGLDSRGGIDLDSLTLLNRDVKWHTKYAFKAYFHRDIHELIEDDFLDNLPF